MSVRYTAPEFGFDADGDMVAVGIFPDGPLLSVNPSGFAILAVVADSPVPVTAAEVVTELRSQMTDLPDDIGAQVSDALNSFVEQGLVHRVRSETGA